MRTSGQTWILIGLLSACIATMAFFAARPPLWEVFVIASLIAGGLCVLIWQRGDVDARLVIALALGFRLAFVWMPPVLSDDAYRYVWDGIVQTEGINPYLYIPEDPELTDLHDEPVYQRLNSASYYSVYPPISQLIFRIGARFYESGWEVSYYVIKGILAALEFGAVLVLARLVGPASLLLYAWNPLVLITGAAQAHGEAALVFFLSLVLLCAHQKRGSWAAFFLACAGWVKLYPFVLFPFLWRRFGLRSALAGIAATLAIALPYIHLDAPANVLGSLNLYVRLFEFNAGMYYGIKEIFELATGADWSKQIGPALRLVFLTAVPIIYFLDRRWNWSLRRAFAVTVGAFFLLATTVHPWYIVGLLVLVLPARPPSWHWHWLGLVSIGTYLLYVGGPYWMWVIIGWSGWTLFLLMRYRRGLLDWILRRRAIGKARHLTPFLDRGDRVLDIGAAEGYVSERLVRHTGASAQLADVVDMNRTDIAHTVYGGRRLPFASDAFDVAVLIFVLHHAEDPQRVVSEALRVSKKRVLILESTFERDWEGRVLAGIDRVVNRIRSAGRIDTERVHLRTSEGWVTMFGEMGARVAAKKELGGFIHRKTLYVLDPGQVEIVPTSSSRG